MTQSNRESKFNTFLKIARVLNAELNLIPLLYGSLGLSRVMRHDFQPDDVDILVDPQFLTSEWQQLHDVMRSLGFTLYDLHEHEFKKAGTKVAFAEISELPSFAGIDDTSLAITVYEGIRFKELTVEQYLAVYEACQEDSYRQQKQGHRDAHKIEAIQAYLKNR